MIHGFSHGSLVVSFCPHCGDQDVLTMDTHLLDGRWTCPCEHVLCSDGATCAKCRATVASGDSEATP
jgi:hypothetical protein